MIVPSYARYDYCLESACCFLENYRIDSYPVDLFKIIDESPYALVPYSTIMKEFNCTLDLVCGTLKSKEGRTVYHDGIYTIAYNDVSQPDGRILFTLAHELGHICLNHLIDFEITETPKNTDEPEMPRWQYEVLEREANAFARNILVPVSLYYFLKNKTSTNIRKHFGITLDAATVRANLIEKDYASAKRLGLFSRFMNIYHAFFDKKKCSVCTASVIQKHGDFCPICGSKNTLERGNGDKMKYPLMLTNKNNKLLECPRCSNEETEIEGSFCHICGLGLVNKCTNNYCDILVIPSNARYCPVCGETSSFYDDEILNAWDEKETTYIYRSVDDDEVLPFN